MPSSHRMMRMTAIVSSIVRLIGAPAGAVRLHLSNGCATSPSVSRRIPVLTAALGVGAILVCASVSAAQEAVNAPTTSASTNEQRATSALKFLGGGAIGLLAHE